MLHRFTNCKIPSFTGLLFFTILFSAIRALAYPPHDYKDLAADEAESELHPDDHDNSYHTHFARSPNEDFLEDRAEHLTRRADDDGIPAQPPWAIVEDPEVQHLGRRSDDDGIPAEPPWSLYHESEAQGSRKRSFENESEAKDELYTTRPVLDVRDGEPHGPWDEVREAYAHRLAQRSPDAEDNDDDENALLAARSALYYRDYEELLYARSPPEGGEEDVFSSPPREQSTEAHRRDMDIEATHDEAERFASGSLDARDGVPAIPPWEIVLNQPEIDQRDIDGDAERYGEEIAPDKDSLLHARDETDNGIPAQPPWAITRPSETIKVRSNIEIDTLHEHDAESDLETRDHREFQGTDTDDLQSRDIEDVESVQLPKDESVEDVKNPAPKRRAWMRSIIRSASDGGDDGISEPHGGVTDGHDSENEDVANEHHNDHSHSDEDAAIVARSTQYEASRNGEFAFEHQKRSMSSGDEAVIRARSAMFEASRNGEYSPEHRERSITDAEEEVIVARSIAFETSRNGEYPQEHHERSTDSEVQAGIKARSAAFEASRNGKYLHESHKRSIDPEDDAMISKRSAAFEASRNGQYLDERDEDPAAAEEEPSLRARSAMFEASRNGEYLENDNANTLSTREEPAGLDSPPWAHLYTPEDPMTKKRSSAEIHDTASDPNREDNLPSAALSDPSILRRSAPWSLNVYYCAKPNWGGTCKYHSFTGKDGSKNDHPVWGNTDPIGSFGPDNGLMCALRLKGCKYTNAKCEWRELIYPGVAVVDEPFLHATGEVACFYTGSDGYADEVSWKGKWRMDGGINAPIDHAQPFGNGRRVRREVSPLPPAHVLERDEEEDWVREPDLDRREDIGYVDGDEEKGIERPTHQLDTRDDEDNEENDEQKLQERDAGPWTRATYLCTASNFGIPCTRHTFSGPDSQTTDQHTLTLDAPQDIGSFKPDEGLVCSLLIANCVSHDSSCEMQGLRSPGVAEVEQPWRSHTGVIKCVLEGSKAIGTI